MPNSTKHIGSFRPKVPVGGGPHGKNYLFAIAIDEYAHCPKLYNPVRDALELKAVLSERYAFEPQNIITLFNEAATESNIIHAFRDLARSISPSDNLVLFFSGHGEFDDVFNEGYWIPVDARRGAWEDYIPNSKIRTILNAIRAHHIFLIADSCFSGSLFMTGKDVAANRLDRDPSRWGLTAGRNEIVDDGQPGAHSPFADSLLYHLKNNNKPLGVMELCQKVVEDVSANANQTPRGEPLRVEGHRGGQLFFTPKVVAPQGLADVPEKMSRRHGSLLHNIPEEMEMGRETRCEVRIAFERETLLRDLPPDERVEIQDIRVSNIMEVDLFDPSDETDRAFQVRTFTDREQFIEEDEYTQWVFYVKPLKSGIYSLILKVSVIEYLHGKERKRDIVLEEKVEIVAEMPETVMPANGYKIARANFLADAPEAPVLEAMEPEESRPPVASSPEPSAGAFPTEVVETGGGASRPGIEVIAKMAERKAPSPAPRRRSRRAVLAGIAGVLAIVLGALMVIPNFNSSQITPVDDGEMKREEIFPDKTDASPDLSGNNKEAALRAQLKGRWRVLSFSQNGQPVPVPEKRRMVYTFEKNEMILHFQKDKLSQPFQLAGNKIQWGENTGDITFLSNGQLQIDGFNKQGTFRLIMEKEE